MERRACVITANVPERRAIKHIYARALTAYGRLDIVAANAGSWFRESVGEADWQHVLYVLVVTQPVYLKSSNLERNTLYTSETAGQ